MAHCRNNEKRGKKRTAQIPDGVKLRRREQIKCESRQDTIDSQRKETHKHTHKLSCKRERKRERERERKSASPEHMSEPGSWCCYWGRGVGESEWVRE
jgi:hypothetical protein